MPCCPICENDTKNCQCNFRFKKQLKYLPFLLLLTGCFDGLKKCPETIEVTGDEWNVACDSMNCALTRKDGSKPRIVLKGRDGAAAALKGMELKK